MIKLNAQIRVHRLSGTVCLIPSEGAGGPLQAKTVFPSHDEQVVAPDKDFYGLVSVTVKPVPKLKTANAAFFETGEWFRSGLDVSSSSALYEETEG